MLAREAVHEIRDSEVTAEMIEEVIDSLGSIPAAQKLRDQLEEAEDKGELALAQLFAQALAAKNKREQIIKQRFVTLSTGEIRPSPEGNSKTLARLNEVLQRVKEKGKFLGEGATATVYSDDIESGRCYKIIFNSVEYNKANSVAQEADYLTAVSDLQSGKVRAPQPHYWATRGDYHVLVMERLNGAALDIVLNGSDKLPTNFNVEIAFEELFDFIEKMHSQGIYHRDIAPQNIMVDRETGGLYVIDFGKACSSLANEDPYTERDIQTNEVKQRYMDDMVQAREIKRKIQNFLRKKANLL